MCLAAEHLDMFDPIPYRVINLSTAFGPHSMVASVNFAFGGSGVFPTFGPLFPNISTQINQFKDLLQKSIISDKSIKSSIALSVIAGNDYFAHPYPDNKVGSSLKGQFTHIINSFQGCPIFLHCLCVRSFSKQNI